MNPLDEIVAFVEGHTSLRDFVRTSRENEALGTVLEEDVTIRPYTDAGNLMLYILQQDWSSLAAQVSVQDAMSQFLHVKGRDHTLDRSPLQIYEAILAYTPAWLCLPEFFVDRIVKHAKDALDRKSLAVMVKNEITTSFRCLKKPPRWLQSPNWICVDERPLLFVGQVGLGHLMHDNAQVYLFFDDVSAKVITLIQVA